MAIVSKIRCYSKRKGYIRKTRNVAHTLRFWKRWAHRTYRRTTKIKVRLGEEINEKPRLTDWQLD